MAEAFGKILFEGKAKCRCGQAQDGHDEQVGDDPDNDAESCTLQELDAQIVLGDDRVEACAYGRKREVDEEVRPIQSESRVHVSQALDVDPELFE